MRTEDFDYELPQELIAQTPIPRGESRLLVLHRDDGRIEHRAFVDLLGYLDSGDTLVLNDTRVRARRLLGACANGRPAEALLVAPRGDLEWDALVRPGRHLRAGAELHLELCDGGEVVAAVTESLPGGLRILRFCDRATRDRLQNEGSAPLPPYIHSHLQDEERYQTVYSREPGSAAAPTAGLHFTADMLERLRRRGTSLATVTLHVGLDTFRPVRTADLEEHEMHGEQFRISPEDAALINGTKDRIMAVGTTTVRALESAAVGPRQIRPMEGETRLFITPGFRFQAVEALLTNFHLPRSTLLALVSAFAGRERIMDAYRAAIDARYRFYSFGDAMLIL